jgi:hypothetical protein
VRDDGKNCQEKFGNIFPNSSDAWLTFPAPGMGRATAKTRYDWRRAQSSSSAT